MTDGRQERYVVTGTQARDLSPPWGDRGTRVLAYLTRENSAATGLEVYLSTMAPGASSALHEHDAEQAYFILSGRAVVTIGGHSEEVGENSAVVFPRDVPHSIANPFGHPVTFVAVNTGSLDI